jgi:coenzyme PQQ biosynthesis protein PqqD
MIGALERPLLASKARLRFDRHSQGYMLLYPEKGLALNETAAEVVKLCTGEHDVTRIVALLCERFSAVPRERIEHDVLAFLQTLAERGLLEVAR